MPQAKKVLVAAEQKKILEEQIAILDDRIKGYEFAIEQYKAKDSILIASHKSQLEIADQQKKLLLENVAALNRQLVRERRKRFWTAASGLATTGIAAFFYLTK